MDFCYIDHMAMTVAVAGFYSLKVFALVTFFKIITPRHNQIATLQINVTLKQV